MESVVERYYDGVVRHLKEVGLWEKTLRKFPPEAIKAAVKRVIERLDEHGIDPEYWDWGTFFERLHEFDTVDDWVNWLEEEKYLPPSREEIIARGAAEIERDLTALLDLARQVDVSILRRIRERIAELLGEAESLARLRRELEEYKRRVTVERRLRQEYARRAEELEERLRELRRKIGEVKRTVETARPPVYAEIQAKVTAHIRTVPRVYRIISKENRKCNPFIEFPFDCESLPR